MGAGLCSALTLMAAGKQAVLLTAHKFSFRAHFVSSRIVKYTSTDSIPSVAASFTVREPQQPDISEKLS